MSITAAAMQAELGLTANDAQIIQHTMPLAGSVQEWYVVGNEERSWKVIQQETLIDDGDGLYPGSLR